MGKETGRKPDREKKNGINEKRALKRRKEGGGGGFQGGII